MSHQRKHSDNTGPIYMAGRDIVINNYAAPTTHDLAPQQQQPQPQQRPSLWQRVRNVSPRTWSNIAIVIGAIGCINAIFAATSLRAAVSDICISMMFLLPALWWYYCKSRDKQAQAAYEKELRDTQRARKLLDPVRDATVLHGLNNPMPPTPIRRRWLAISAAALMLGMVGSGLADNTPETPIQIEHHHTTD